MISGVREAKTFLSAIYQRSEDPTHKLPYVTLTYAQSLDGKIAGPGGKQVTLSSNESMAMTHRLRVINDGILIGIGTLLKDDPRLTARIVEPDEIPNQPQPIILDSKLQFPLKSNLMLSASQGGGKYPWIFCAPDHSTQRRQALEAAGVQVFVVSRQGDKLSIPEILRKTEELGIRKLMVEGGANVIQEFLASGYVNLCLITLAPIYIGGSGVSFVENGDYRPLSRLSDIRYHQFGVDMVIAGYASPTSQRESQNYSQQAAYPPSQQSYGGSYPTSQNYGYSSMLPTNDNKQQTSQPGNYPQRPHGGVYPPNPEGGPPLPPRSNTNTNPQQSYPPKGTPGYPPQVTSGYPPKGGSSYPSQTATGYPPQASSGYPPQAGLGYPPQVGLGYPPQAGSGYPPQAASGYPPKAPSGHPPQASSGYPPQAASGYPPKVTSDHPPQASSGYPPQAASGYPPKVTSDHPPQAASGYPPKAASSHPPQASSGYPPQAVSGYPSQANVGYPPQTTTGYPPQVAAGYPPQANLGYPPKPVQTGYPPLKTTAPNQPPSPGESSPLNVYPLKSSQSGYPSAGYPPPGYSPSSNTYPPSSK